MRRKKTRELTGGTEKGCLAERREGERKSRIRNTGGETRKKGGGQVGVRVYMHLDVRLCSHASKGDEKRERNRERKRQTALHSDNVRAGTARRTKGVGNPRAGKRASERANGTVRTTDYIDFDFRRRAHLVFSGSAHSCRSRLPRTLVLSGEKGTAKSVALGFYGVSICLRTRARPRSKTLTSQTNITILKQ